MSIYISTSAGPVLYALGTTLPDLPDGASLKYAWKGYQGNGPLLVCKTLPYQGTDQRWDREIAAITTINGRRKLPDAPPGLDRIVTYLDYGVDANNNELGHIIMEAHGKSAKKAAEDIDEDALTDESTKAKRRAQLVKAVLRDGLVAASALAECGIYSRDLHPYNFLLPPDFHWDGPPIAPHLTICDFSHSYCENGTIPGTENTTRGMHYVRPPGLLKELGEGGRKHDGLADEAFSVAAAAYLTATGNAPYTQSDGANVTPSTSLAQSKSWALSIDRDLLRARLHDESLANDIVVLLDIGEEEQKKTAADRTLELDRVLMRLAEPDHAGRRGHLPKPPLPPTLVQIALPEYIATTPADFAPIVTPPPPPPLSAQIMNQAVTWRPHLQRVLDWAVPVAITIAVTLLWVKGFNSWIQSALQVIPWSDPVANAILVITLFVSSFASVFAMMWSRPLAPRAVVAAAAPLAGALTFLVGLGVASFHRVLYREISMLPWTAADWGTTQLVVFVIAILAVLLFISSWSSVAVTNGHRAWIAGSLGVALLTAVGLPAALAGFRDITGRPEPPCDNPAQLSDPMRSVCFDKAEGWSQLPLTERPFNTWGPTATLQAANLPCLTAQVIAYQFVPGLEPTADGDPIELTGMGPNPATASLTPMNNSGTRVRRVAGDNIYVMYQGQPAGTEDTLTLYQLISNPESPDATGRRIVGGVGSTRAEVVLLERGCTADSRPAIDDLQDSLLAGVRAKSLNHADDFYIAMDKTAAAAAGITTVTVPLHGDAWPALPATEQDLAKKAVIAEATLNLPGDTLMRVQVATGQAGAGEPSDLASDWAITGDSREPGKKYTVIRQFEADAPNDTFLRVSVYHRDEAAIESTRESVSATLEGIEVQ